ncbi:sugar phosphate isomerase/epimerase family protein [Actinokineospora iranica]|uniref:Sugar phosphate isomerase/epimerase n=1 Tax=Actinokineospora iranica TaxID=1271860 RepID=A0A1G6MCU6_9PSEU|nr:sugar phosphate isomerase/epimerase family protein [Actinokineospora iranica]SDC53418.1 Sugar phosphate isomerase/epimerase [Actinokineospora iranica]
MRRESLAPPVLAGIGDEAGPALADQVAALAELGWSAIELRTVDGVRIADLDDAAFDAVAATLAEHGVSTVCVDSAIGDWSTLITGDFGRDLAQLRALERRCARLGARYVRVMSYPNDGLHDDEWERRVLRRMRELALRAEQADLVLLHENCAGWAGQGAEHTLRMLEEADSPALRLLFDTGNGLAYGYSALDQLTVLAEHVEHVHIKDGLAGPVWTLPGEGEVDLMGCLKVLADNGYRGALSIEPHLSLRPHDGDGGTGAAEGFVAAGRALARLLTRVGSAP